PDARGPLRRPRAEDAGEAVDVAWRRPKDGEPGADPRVQEPREHLRRHARAPHLEPPGVGEDADAGRDRAGALRCDGGALVAVHQPVSGDVGPERVPSRVSALRRVRDSAILLAGRCDAGVKGTCAIAWFGP